MSRCIWLIYTKPRNQYLSGDSIKVRGHFHFIPPSVNSVALRPSTFGFEAKYSSNNDQASKREGEDRNEVKNKTLCITGFLGAWSPKNKLTKLGDAIAKQ